MSPRPRTVSDERIFIATAHAITRLGPTRLTLADVAGEVGLSAAALVQRFGSKRQLLLAYVRQGAGMVDDGFVAARAANSSPLAALISVATAMAQGVRSPNELVNLLAFVQIDLSDPDFRRPALAQSRHLLAGYETLLRDAIDAGELVQCDVRRVARALQAIANGSLVTWAINRDGRVMPFVGRDIETLLMPLRTPRSLKRPRSAGGGGGASSDRRVARRSR
jgi:AcrR family transcriptional regulator